MTASRLAMIGILLALSACDMPKPLPLAMPVADGRGQTVIIGDGFKYVVNYQALDQASGKVYIRVTRSSAPELDYAAGLTAKKVAVAFCALYNRGLNPATYGMFSTPSSWMFEGGCT